MANSRKPEKVIAHLLDGTLVKGETTNFYPRRAKFDLSDANGLNHKLHVSELKALFFVRNLNGGGDYHERKGFFTEEGKGSKVLVEFFDGELLFGYTLNYTGRGNGFFMTPGDPDSNNDKVFVVLSSTKRVKVRDDGKAATGRSKRKRARSRS